MADRHRGFEVFLPRPYRPDPLWEEVVEWVQGPPRFIDQT